MVRRNCPPVPQKLGKAQNIDVQHLTGSPRRFEILASGSSGEQEAGSIRRC
jgi:hypothetical protein